MRIKGDECYLGVVTRPITQFELSVTDSLWLDDMLHAWTMWDFIPVLAEQIINFRA